MSRGAFRGAAVAWLGLAALDALLSTHGAESVSGALGVLNSVAQRALSPDVALIPDFSSGAGTSTPGMDINPVATGQASSDGSSGHQYDQGGTVQTPTNTVPINPAPAVHAVR